MTSLALAAATIAITLSPPHSVPSPGPVQSGGTSPGSSPTQAPKDARQGSFEYARLRMDDLYQAVAREPWRVDLWKRSQDLITTIIGDAGDRTVVDQGLQLIAVGDGYFTIDPRQALIQWDQLEAKVRAGSATDADTAELRKIETDYMEAHACYRLFLWQTIRMLADTPGAMERNSRLFGAAMRSSVGGAFAAGHLVFARVPWSALPADTREAMLSIALTGRAAESLAMIATCHNLGCPHELLAKAAANICADVRRELPLDRPGPVRSAIAELYLPDPHPQHCFIDLPPGDLLEIMMEIARSPKSSASEAIAAVSAIRDMLAPEQAPGPRRDIGPTIDAKFIESAVAALRVCDFGVIDVMRLEAVFKPLYACAPQESMHAEQILALLRSEAVEERAVGKMLFESLGNLGRDSATRLKGELCSAALALRSTPYEPTRAAVTEYLARPCDHPAVRPSHPL